MIANRDFTPKNKRRIIELVHSYETLEDVVKLAMEYSLQAKQALSDFPDSIYREALLRFPEFVIDRKM